MNYQDLVKMDKCRYLFEPEAAKVIGELIQELKNHINDNETEEGDIVNPTYDQLLDITKDKEYLVVAYTKTNRITCNRLSGRGEYIFASDALGHAVIIADKDGVKEGVSDIVVKNTNFYDIYE